MAQEEAEELWRLGASVLDRLRERGLPAAQQEVFLDRLSGWRRDCSGKHELGCELLVLTSHHLGQPPMGHPKQGLHLFWHSCHPFAACASQMKAQTCKFTT